MPTKAAPQTIEDATAALRVAEGERDALLQRIHKSGDVEPIDLAAAEAAVTIASSRLDAAHDAEAASIERERQARVAELRAQYVDAFDQRSQIAADVDAAVDALARAMTTARERQARLRDLSVSLANAGPLPDGDTATAGRFVDDLDATVEGRRFTTLNMSPAALAADTAVTALRRTYGDTGDIVATQTFALLARFARAGGRPSDRYR